MSTFTMPRFARSAFIATAVAGVCFAAAQAAEEKSVLPPSSLYKPLTTDWASYSGDYTGQRFSRLTQVDRNSVKQLTLAWVSRMNTTTNTAVIGGEGKGDFPVAGASMKGSVLE